MPPARSKKPLEREFSAGGVVVRGEECVVLVPFRRSPENKQVLALPKGHIDPGERAPQTAIREAREEGGVDSELVEKLGDITYWYQTKESRILKKVSFFLLRYVNGDPADHDDEIEEAFWMPLEEASTALSYAGERDMVVRALSRLAGDR